MLGHNQVKSPNENINQLANGMKFRLEVSSAGNAGRVGAEFFATKAEMGRRRSQLREAGYVGTRFAITDDGGLSAI